MYLHSQLRCLRAFVDLGYSPVIEMCTQQCPAHASTHIWEERCICTTMRVECIPNDEFWKVTVVCFVWTSYTDTSKSVNEFWKRMTIFALTMRVASEIHWAAFPTTNFFIKPQHQSHQAINWYFHRSTNSENEWQFSLSPYELHQKYTERRFRQLTFFIKPQHQSR